MLSPFDIIFQPYNKKYTTSALQVQAPVINRAIKYKTCEENE